MVTGEGSHFNLGTLQSINGIVNFLQAFAGHENYVLGIAWSPDNKAVASASGDTTVRIWYLDGRPARSLAGHQAPVIDVAWSPTGDRLASASADDMVRVWSAEGKPLQTLAGQTVRLVPLALATVIEEGSGLISMGFLHRSSRAGDPALHFHVVSFGNRR